MIRWLQKIWGGLVEPGWAGNDRERYRARVLNIILIIFLAWGILFEFRSTLNSRVFQTSDTFAILVIGLLSLPYFLNRQGQFYAAVIFTLGILIAATFASVLPQTAPSSNSLSALYYLVIAILISDLFFSMRGYLITVAIILGGVFAISRRDPEAESIFVFLFVFCTLLGFSSYNRRSMLREQIQLASKYTYERSLLAVEQRRSAQLSLLEEVGRQITNSLDEQEILERTLEAVVKKFGYAEAAISLLTNDDVLEVAAISGTQDFGYRPGYQQKLGKGIIGHVAKTRQAHMADDISIDPYYFSSAERSGSAMGIPILDKDQLLGVIYVESTTKHAIQTDDMQTLQTLANQVATALQKARLYARTQEHLRVMTTLQSVSVAVTSSLELDQILNNVIQLLKDSFGYTYISVYLLERDMLRLGAQLGYPNHMVIHELPITSGVMGRTVRTQETQFVRDASKDPDFLRASNEVKSEIALPLLKDDKVLGILNVESTSETLLQENDVDLLKALAGSIAIAIDNARLHAEVKLKAMTDVLSGLANRRAFDEILLAEMARVIRYNQPISLIILDLDSFKVYNDEWGHPAGDLRLREVADILSANVREPDIVARYGGEEFAIILPNTSKEGAIQLAERLRESTEASSPSRTVEGSPIPGYTISLGVATFPDDATSVGELLLAADNAERTAKRLGKNRVYAAHVPSKIQNS